MALKSPCFCKNEVDHLSCITIKPHTYTYTMSSFSVTQATVCLENLRAFRVGRGAKYDELKPMPSKKDEKVMPEKDCSGMAKSQYASLFKERARGRTHNRMMMVTNCEAQSV